MFGIRWERQIAIRNLFPSNIHSSPRDLNQAFSPRAPISTPNISWVPSLSRPPPSLKDVNKILNLRLLRAPKYKAAPLAQARPAWGAGARLESASGAASAFRPRAAGERGRGHGGIWNVRASTGGVKCPSAAPARPPRQLRYRIWTMILQKLDNVLLGELLAAQLLHGPGPLRNGRRHLPPLPPLYWAGPPGFGLAPPQGRGASATRSSRGRGHHDTPPDWGQFWVTSALCSAGLFVESGVKPAEVAPKTDSAEKREISPVHSWDPCEATTAGGSDCLPQITHICILTTSCCAFKVGNLKKTTVFSRLILFYLVLP